MFKVTGKHAFSAMNNYNPQAHNVLKCCMCLGPHSRSENFFGDHKRSLQKPIFQELISRVILEIETRGQVFSIALGPVTVCIAIRTIGLLYLFYNTG